MNVPQWHRSLQTPAPRRARTDERWASPRPWKRGNSCKTRIQAQDRISNEPRVCPFRNLLWYLLQFDLLFVKEERIVVKLQTQHLYNTSFFSPESLTANIYPALNSGHFRHQLSEALFKRLILPLDSLLVSDEYKIVGSSQV